MPGDDRMSPPMLPQLAIIVGAMVLAVVSFGVVSLVVGPVILEEKAQARLLLVLLGVVGVLEIVGFMIARAILTGRLRRTCEEDAGSPPAGAADPFPVFFSLTLIRSALCEGFAMFGLAIVLLHGEKIALGAAAIALLVLIAGMPTESRYRRFVEDVPGGNPYAGN
jgi:hypothetical protein